MNDLMVRRFAPCVCILSIFSSGCGLDAVTPLPSSDQRHEPLVVVSTNPFLSEMIDFIAQDDVSIVTVPFRRSGGMPVDTVFTCVEQQVHARFLKRYPTRRPPVNVVELIDDDAIFSYEVSDPIDTFDPSGKTRTVTDGTIWSDPLLWIKAVDVVGDSLVNLAPDRAAQYRARAAQYKNRLIRLHGFIEETISGVPRDARIVVTDTPELEYFTNRYDIQLIHFDALFSNSENQTMERAMRDRAEEYAGLVIKHDIRQVFVSDYGDELFQQVATICKTKHHKVVNWGSLQPTTGFEANGEAPYMSMMKGNALRIAASLK